MIIELLLQGPFLVHHEVTKWNQATFFVLTPVPSLVVMLCDPGYVIVGFHNRGPVNNRIDNPLIIVIPILVLNSIF